MSSRGGASAKVLQSFLAVPVVALVVLTAGCAGQAGAPRESPAPTESTEAQPGDIEVTAAESATCETDSMVAAVSQALARPTESPDGNAMALPQQLRALGIPEQDVRKQALGWAALTEDERIFQICLNIAEGSFDQH
jgi:hypothetical protein